MFKPIYLYFSGGRRWLPLSAQRNPPGRLHEPHQSRHIRLGPDDTGGGRVRPVAQKRRRLAQNPEGGDSPFATKLTRRLLGTNQIDDPPGSQRTSHSSSSPSAQGVVSCREQIEGPITQRIAGRKAEERNFSQAIVGSRFLHQIDSAWLAGVEERLAINEVNR